MRGSIRRRGTNSFELRFDLERVNGKRRSRSVAFKGTFKEAQKELSRLLASADAGTLIDPSNMTVGEYLNAWLDSTLTQSPKTLERYRELAARQVAPHLGSIKIQKLMPEHIERWHAALLSEGLSPRTVGHAHRVLGAALRRAVENGTLARNVAAIRKPPAVEQDEIEILAPEQIAAVLDSLQGHSLHPIVSLALATGLRRGELLALQWSDIDLDRGVLRVERSVEETKAGLTAENPQDETRQEKHRAAGRNHRHAARASQGADGAQACLGRGRSAGACNSRPSRAGKSERSGARRSADPIARWANGGQFPICAYRCRLLSLDFQRRSVAQLG